MRNTDPPHKIKIRTNDVIMPTLRRKERKTKDVEKIAYKPWLAIY